MFRGGWRGMARDFITLLIMVCTLRHMNCLFFEIWTVVEHRSLKLWEKVMDKGALLYMCLLCARVSLDYGQRWNCWVENNNLKSTYNISFLSIVV